MDEDTNLDPAGDTALPRPEPGEPMWVLDALARPEDPGVLQLLEADLPERALDVARLASTGAALLEHLGVPSFDEVSAQDLTDLVLTPDQGRAWQTVPGVLSMLRVTIRGRSRGLKFVVCTGCGRWMLSKQVPKTKSCPLTMDCHGPQVDIPAGVVTSAPVMQIISR